MNPAPAPTLRGARVVLPVPTPEDAAPMAAFVLRNREHLAPWEPLRPPAYTTEAHWREAFAAAESARAAGTAVRFLIALAGRPGAGIVGHCGLSQIARGPFQSAVLGYALDRDHQGHGLMAEALRLVLAYAHGELNLHRVMANYMPVNARSAGLLRRLGFQVEGYARDYLLLAGGWQDHVLAAHVDPDWRPR